MHAEIAGIEGYDRITVRATLCGCPIVAATLRGCPIVAATLRGCPIVAATLRGCRHQGQPHRAAPTKKAARRLPPRSLVFGVLENSKGKKLGAWGSGFSIQWNGYLA
ncbi:hypothetical protein [Haliscomenobacter sp.]|uniref:hypothetical protein n=1 Tax=Haliscomenobacter sp. TaxID=2717303 RepID=UPI003BAACD10